jgi:reactive intermediate/imine deaminase
MPGMRMLDSTIQEQTRTALENVKAVVETGGSTMANVVKCTVFLVDVKDFQGMNSVYSTFWPKDPPARSTVVVAALVRADAKLEVECIAAIPK